jgi:hypothetical protein
VGVGAAQVALAAFGLIRVHQHSKQLAEKKVEVIEEERGLINETPPFPMVRSPSQNYVPEFIVSGIVLSEGLAIVVYGVITSSSTGAALPGVIGTAQLGIACFSAIRCFMHHGDQQLSEKDFQAAALGEDCDLSDLMTDVDQIYHDHNFPLQPERQESPEEKMLRQITAIVQYRKEQKLALLTPA